MLEEAVARRSSISRKGSRTSARWSPTCAPPRWTSWGSTLRSTRSCERASRHGLEIDRSLDLAYEQGREPTRHTAELETAIYRIIQEALTNATKHGHAKRAVIEIRETPTTVELTVRDDGHGFDPATSTTGFGLLGIARARRTAPRSGPNRILPRQRHDDHSQLPRDPPPPRSHS